MSGIDRRTLIGSRGKLVDLTDVTTTGATAGDLLSVAQVDGTGNAAAFRSTSRAALQQEAVKRAATSTLYQPTPTALLRWRTLREQALNTAKQGHIAVLGDSIGFGTGSTSPVYNNSYVGQLRKRLDSRYGTAGTGIVPCNNDIKATPSLDPRFTLSANVTAQAWGLHQYGMFNLPAATDYVEFTATADEFYVYTNSGSNFSYSFDGGAATNVAGSSKLTGYSTPHAVFKFVPGGALASHKLRITGSSAGAMQVFGFEGLVTGNGRFRVSNQSIAGKSLATLFGNASSGETSGLRGLPFIDTLKADLLLIGLGINDWQGATSVATSKTYLVDLITRQRASGTNAIGGPKAAGEAVLVWNPQPHTADVPTGLQPVGGPTWDAYRDTFYQVANEQDVALIDLGALWQDYATGNGFALFTDRIHPNDKGAGDLSGAMNKALFYDC